MRIMRVCYIYNVHVYIQSVLVLHMYVKLNKMYVVFVSFNHASNEYMYMLSLQNLYTSSSPLISQMYIYGNSLQSNIVAVVVPQSDGLMAWWKENHQDNEGNQSSHNLFSTYVPKYSLCVV